MGGGIGNSQKRPQNKPLKFGRPIIGRLGIGLLGIAQICGAFTITSKTRKGEGFKARVRLYDLLKEKLDKDDETVVKATEVDVGEYNFEDFDASEAREGTLILADAVHPSFTRAFQNSLEFEDFEEPPSDWVSAVAIVSRVHSLQQLGDYWRLLWELAASCPIPYIDEHALPEGLIVDQQAKLLKYHFEVRVDGLKILKPVYLEGNPGGYTALRIPNQTLKVYGNEVAFSGYIIVQEGAQLKPDELRGVMVRIKNIGIGYYDPSMLDYRFNEGPRSRWLTSEIFVEEGLENALNVDRDSFNRFHPEFRAIQEFIHGLLHTTVFPQTYQSIKLRSANRAKRRERDRQAHLKEVLAETMDKRVELQLDGESMPTVVETSRQLRVRLPDPDSIDTKKANRQLASAVLALSEVARHQPTAETRRQLFALLLLKLLKRW
jgi:hypothetical protein